MPTRTGYSFVGWKGSNYLNGYKFNKSDYVESFYFKNDTLSITSVTKTIPEEVAGTEQAYLGIYLSLPKGKYMVAYENRTYTETIDYPYLTLLDRSVDPQEHIWGNKVSDGASGTCFTLDKDYSTLYFVVYANINSNGWTSGTITYKGLMIYKVSSENEYVAYEPYYIESDTIFGTPGDRTLTAEWGTLMGSTTNYSSWTASEGVSSYSCSGDTITITSKDNLLSQAYLRQDISLTAGTYKFCFDSCTYSGVKPYPIAIIYDSTSGWLSVPGTQLDGSVGGDFKNVCYFTFTSTHSCSFIVYACIDLGQSSCTVSFKNLRLIKLP